MEKQARLVIIGAGIVGCSAAYHLTRRILIYAPENVVAPPGA